MKKKRLTETILYHILVAGFGFLMIYPLLWMAMSSFKESNVVFRESHILIPQTWHPENYLTGWKGFGGYTFATFFSNSFRIAVISTFGSVLSSSLIAFGFARLRFKGRGFWFTCVMMTMMLPFQVVMIPQFLIFKGLGWLNTILPLTVPYFFGQAFFIFQNMQFIRGIPADLDEAARIDGCTYYGIYARIILPLIKPSLVTTAIFSFMWRWDDFFGALLYLNSPRKYTLSIALKMFSDPTTQSDWGAMFAMSTLSILPIVVIFLFFQKYLVEGISTEGLKG